MSSRRTSSWLFLANTLADLAEAQENLGEVEEARKGLDESIRLLQDYPENAWARRRLGTVLAQRRALQNS